MSFPLTVGGVTVDDPPALAALVQADCGAEPVHVPGRRPSRWVVELVAAGALDRRLAVALAVALLEAPSPAPLAEGARLAAALAEPLLGPLVMKALAEQDPLVLLQLDPGAPGSSVEDTLAAAVEGVADLTHPELRAAFLAVLRHSGQSEREVRVLARFGTAAELRGWLPAVLAEPLSDGQRAALAARRERGDDGGAVIAEQWSDAAS